jgi:phosphatidylglycerophosphatase A
MTTSPECGPDEPESEVVVDVGLLRDPAHFLALGFGAGLAPVAPGTFGSLVGLGIGACLLGGPGRGALAAATLLAVLAGIVICGSSARRLGVHDHPAIVWDEIAGQMIALLAAPATWWGGLLAFAAFRLFDIWKPWPIREVDHGMRGGLGIMLDDVLAGLLAALTLVPLKFVA